MKKNTIMLMIVMLIASIGNFSMSFATSVSVSDLLGVSSTNTNIVTGKPLDGVVICVDPGHGSFSKSVQEPVSPNSNVMKAGFVSGTAGAICTEAEVNLTVGLMLKEKLESQGATVIMTRDTKVATLSNVGRAKLGNESNAALAIRIHCDGSTSKAISGMSMLVPSSKYVGEALAKKSTEVGEIVLKNALETTGAKSRGIIVREDLIGFNWSTVPTILIEMGFMSNTQEDALLSSWDYQQKLADGMVAGIVEYYGKTVVQEIVKPDMSILAENNGLIENNVYVENSGEILNRVNSYMAINSGMTYDEALWKVKANIDKAEFTEARILTTDEMNSITVLINKKNKIPDGYVPADLVKLTDRVSLRSEAKDAFEKMSVAATEQKLRLSALSGFRTVEYQSNLYNGYLRSDSLANVETYSARPGYSEHHTGLAIDVQGSFGGMLGFGNTKEYLWVKEYGHVYGFIIRYTQESKDITGYKNEPWHIRYVGVDIATKMKTEGIPTLEEYVGKYVR